MTLTESDVNELLDEAIGAARYERTMTRTNQRNGSRDRLLATNAGDVHLKIPKLRKGSFFPSILERRRRIDRTLFAVVIEANGHGVSTRKVDDLVAALGAATGISKSEVRRLSSTYDHLAGDRFSTSPRGVIPVDSPPALTEPRLVTHLATSP